MNILVIGNGFDLAHGLPTKYTDFLEFCKMIRNVYTVDERDAEDDKEMEKIWNKLQLNPSHNLDGLKNLFYDINSKRIKKEKCEEDNVIFYKKIITQTCYDEFYNNIDKNLWIDYFLQNPTYQKENWIDFENEISKAIKSVDADMKSNIEEKISYEKLSNEYLKNNFMTYDDLFGSIDGVEDDITRKSFGELRDILYNDLCRLIRALDIYLCEYVEKIEIKEKSPDINGLVINFILSFNYTHTTLQLMPIAALSPKQ